MEDNRKIKVLIIEDDDFIAMVYEDQLSDVQNIEFELDRYSLMNEGLKALETNEYDVLLLDLNLPDSDFRNTIDSIPKISYKLPVVIMTSANDELLALKTMNKGGQDYLVKDKLNRTLFIRSILYSIERHTLRHELQEEKDKTERLLKNILPESIAEELKTFGQITARHYDKVSVMFVDFADFTKFSSKMNPSQLVDDLHSYFSAFDEVIEQLKLEKIKTIGDAYMVAGGIPTPSHDHIERMVEAAFEIMKLIEEKGAKRKDNGESYWRARIGIHVGPAVAGVVGSRKFTYDIWGDTVNTASRIETNSEVGKINVSETIYQELKNSKKYSFESRGQIEAKGKGKLEMYFVHN